MNKTLILIAVINIFDDYSYSTSGIVELFCNTNARGKPVTQREGARVHRQRGGDGDREGDGERGLTSLLLPSCHIG